jgi:hypothetical protein
VAFSRKSQSPSVVVSSKPLKMTSEIRAPLMAMLAVLAATLWWLLKNANWLL